ncbi:hypothetical protein Pint_17987 [Pistacia integerrima]|uniref:Uncharacterized protein n=1 Tax=Pistacia integerrima TaxID=434235 RepID=A0ACC0YZX7_9ROSI|nr:hypothetical protein Pint_17987 [Pistacia integerrima]
MTTTSFNRQAIAKWSASRVLVRQWLVFFLGGGGGVGGFVFGSGGVRVVVVQLYPDKEFKVEAELPLSNDRYLLNRDNDMNFIFQEYEIKGMRTIRVYVEAKPLDCVEDNEVGQETGAEERNERGA